MMRAMFGLVLVAGVGLAGAAVFMARNYISKTETALERELQAPANLPKHGWPALRTALSFNPAERTITAQQLRDALGATSSWLQRLRLRA